jgi:FOG: CheY-like receiver
MPRRIHQTASAERRPSAWVAKFSRMPLMSGEEMVAALRRQRPNQAILHVSGSHGVTSRPEHLPADVSTLYKPFTPEELVEAARRMIPAAGT